MITQRNLPLSHGGAMLLAASLLSALPASAATYQYRQFIPGLTASPVPSAQDPVAALTVALSGAALPAGMVSQPYSYNLNQLLAVTGDASYDASAVSWSVAAGALPNGLSLSGTGVVSGTPTAKNEAGASFEVLATYKTESGRQAYTIVVNGAVLQVSQVSAGAWHTCAVTTSGGVKCWGRGDTGRLGSGTVTNRLVPLDVQGLTSGVISVAAGRDHTCALTTTGGLKCWGHNSNGQLGNGTDANQLAPVDVQGLSSGVASVVLGSSHTCALTTAGGVKCWGSGAFGQLGNNTTVGVQRTPVDVQGLTSGVGRIATGSNHTCAVTIAGGLKCWGYGYEGTLGNGGTTSSSVPVDVSGLSTGVAGVAAGGAHTCALTSADGLKCWGYNADGQVGNGVTSTIQATPVNVQGLTSGVVRVVLTASASCAVTHSGGLKCWGAGGALSGTSTSPKDMFGLTGITDFTMGQGHACVVHNSTALKCWGANTYGEVGNNTTASQATPTEVLP